MSQRGGVVGTSGGAETAKTAVSPLRSAIREASGTGFASVPGVLRGGVAALLMMTLPACVVLREPGFEPPPNTPPSVEEPPRGFTPSPLNRIIEVDDTFVPGEDQGMPSNELRFIVDVRDPDVNDLLVARVTVNRPTQTQVEIILARDDTLEPTGLPVREYEFLVGLEFFEPAPSCNLVEVFVSREFRTPLDVLVDPQDDEDIGTAAWFVARSDESGTVNIDACRRFEP